MQKESTCILQSKVGIWLRLVDQSAVGRDLMTDPYEITKEISILMCRSCLILASNAFIFSFLFYHGTDTCCVKGSRFWNIKQSIHNWSDISIAWMVRIFVGLSILWESNIRHKYNTIIEIWYNKRIICIKFTYYWHGYCLEKVCREKIVWFGAICVHQKLMNWILRPFDIKSYIEQEGWEGHLDDQLMLQLHWECWFL